MKTLPDDAKTQLLNQLFTPTSSGSTVSSGGKTVQVGGEKYNPLANVFLEKGWAMFDAKGNVNLSEPKRVAEKDTWKKLDDDTIFNSATGEKKELADMAEKDWDVIYNDVIKDAEGQVKAFFESTIIEGADPVERDKQVRAAQERTKLIVATRLAMAGMTDPEMVQDYADAAVGDLDWKTWLKEKSGVVEPPAPTKREDPYDEKTFSGLQNLYDEDEKEITDNLDKYYDAYGKANVDALFAKKEQQPNPFTKKNDFKKWPTL